jgi:hypothetical protein
LSYIQIMLERGGQRIVMIGQIMNSCLNSSLLSHFAWSEKCGMVTQCKRKGKQKEYWLTQRNCPP